MDRGICAMHKATRPTARTGDGRRKRADADAFDFLVCKVLLRETVGRRDGEDERHRQNGSP